MEVQLSPCYSSSFNYFPVNDDFLISSRQISLTNNETDVDEMRHNCFSFGCYTDTNLNCSEVPEVSTDIDKVCRRKLNKSKLSGGTNHILAVKNTSSSYIRHPCHETFRHQRRRRSNSSGFYPAPPPPTPMLPPCRVCGEKASGFHYGANTCEACKGFFRRSLQRKESYRCFGTGNCNILPGKRSVCAACRYRKCISIGMSKKAIKTGRYTHEKRTRDIQEVKRLQRQQQGVMNGVDVLNEPSNRSIINKLPIVNDENVDTIIERIMAIHRIQTPHTQEFFEMLPQKEQEYLVSRNLQQKLFGSFKPITYQEYFKIYHSTGIDVDGRRAMLEHMVPCIEKSIKRFIAFAKAIPGFKDLPIEDQVQLIKGSRFEAWLISTYRAFNSEHLIYTHFCGHTVHLEEMSRLYDDQFLHSVFKVANMIKQLELTEDEECILKAILILFRDRCPLQAPEQVEASQMRMVETLQLIHSRKRPRDKIFFGRIITVLMEMRTLTDLHALQEGKLNMEWATDFEMPPLLYELFSV